MPSADRTTYRAHFSVHADHPALAGHFPGNPIVPGVLILDRVCDIAEAWLGHGLGALALPRARFAAPLRPGESARVELVREGSAIEFRVLRQGVQICQGIVQPAEASGR